MEVTDEQCYRGLVAYWSTWYELSGGPGGFKEGGAAGFSPELLECMRSALKAALGADD